MRLAESSVNERPLNYVSDEPVVSILWRRNSFFTTAQCNTYVPKVERKFFSLLMLGHFAVLRKRNLAAMV